ncbi:hypothetical protein [Kribbella sp. NPDC023855]|uniref:hypothetical protein n=1 Tax=Kribbella sp. NPDC023855 TaxID=3154698 RepID=UPI0033C75637
MRRVGSVAMICGLVFGLAGCGDPDQQMRTEGAKAARDAVSQVRTARLAGQSLLDQKIITPTTTVLVTDAEEALGKVATSFSARQPETAESRKIYDQTTEALSTAEEGVTDLRIALRSGDLAKVRSQVDELGKTGDQLAKLGEQAK